MGGFRPAFPISTGLTPSRARPWEGPPPPGTEQGTVHPPPGTGPPPRPLHSAGPLQQHGRPFVYDDNATRFDCTTDPDSPQPSCSRWQDPNEADQDTGFSESTPFPSMYHSMMEFVNAEFAEARGQQRDRKGPNAPGSDGDRTRGGPVLLARAPPLDFFMQQADSAYLKAIQRKQTSLPYPSDRYAKMYKIRDQEEAGQPVPVNPNLRHALLTGSREPKVIRPVPEVARMEGTVDRSRNALNYAYWCLGALHRLATRNLPAQCLEMEEQLFKGVRMALNDACRDFTFVNANLRAWRREAYLSYLRPTFAQEEKSILRQSPIFSSLLFEEDKLQEALQAADRNANRTLHEAAIKALARPRPTAGTPLVERGTHPPTYSVPRTTTAPTRRPPVQPRQRENRGESSRSQTYKPAGQYKGRKGRPFRK